LLLKPPPLEPNGCGTEEKAKTPASRRRPLQRAKASELGFEAVEGFAPAFVSASASVRFEDIGLLDDDPRFAELFF